MFRERFFGSSFYLIFAQLQDRLWMTCLLKSLLSIVLRIHGLLLLRNRKKNALTHCDFSLVHKFLSLHYSCSRPKVFKAEQAEQPAMRTCVNFKKSSGEKKWLTFFGRADLCHSLSSKTLHNSQQNLSWQFSKEIRRDTPQENPRIYPRSRWNIGLFHLHLLSKLYCLVTARFFLSKPSPQEEEINCQLSSHLSWAFFSINLFIVCLVFLYKVKGNFAHLSQAKLLLFNMSSIVSFAWKVFTKVATRYKGASKNALKLICSPEIEGKNKMGQKFCFTLKSSSSFHHIWAFHRSLVFWCCSYLQTLQLPPNVQHQLAPGSGCRSV